MKFKEIPSQAFLKEILNYDHATGILTWKFRENGTAMWNGKNAYKPAGVVNPNGYLQITINYKKYKAHRIIWVYVNGDNSLPLDSEIDHRNLIRTDNHIDNLRLATKGLNTANMRSRSRKWFLPKGVSKNKSRFLARIMTNGVQTNLGTYDTPEEAHAIYIEAAKKLHGEFARAG